MQGFWKDIEIFFTGSAWIVIGFLATLLFGIIIIRISCKLLRKILFKTAKSKTLCGFMLSIIRFVLYLILIFVLAAIAGISMTPLVTALGAAGLAVGLALQDSLANIANGVLIVSTKPFKVGDYIEIDGISGTVKAIRMITIELLTPDNRKITLPNSKVISGSIINYSARPTRRIEFIVSVQFDSDARKVKQILLQELTNHELIMENPAPVVYFNSYKQNLEFSARGWVNTQDYWTVYWDLNEKIYFALREGGVQIPHGFTRVEITGGGQENTDCDKTDTDNIDNGFTGKKEDK